MLKKCFALCLLMLLAFLVKAQVAPKRNSYFHTRCIGVQGGLSLLENPFVLYPSVNLNYSRTVLGTGRHQLAVYPQLGVILLPGVETKLFFSVSLQYKYVSAKRLEASFFGGFNYQQRWLAYNRYAFENNELKNKGRLRHQFGPVAGLNIGYKIIKKENYSLSPFMSFSVIKLNKNYQSALFAGYKPVVSFGLNLNK
jgi:hypothetical protein